MCAALRQLHGEVSSLSSLLQLLQEWLPPGASERWLSSTLTWRWRRDDGALLRWAVATVRSRSWDDEHAVAASTAAAASASAAQQGDSVIGSAHVVTDTAAAATAAGPALVPVIDFANHGEGALVGQTASGGRQLALTRDAAAALAEAEGAEQLFDRYLPADAGGAGSSLVTLIAHFGVVDASFPLGITLMEDSSEEESATSTAGLLRCVHTDASRLSWGAFSAHTHSLSSESQ